MQRVMEMGGRLEKVPESDFMFSDSFNFGP